jgi:ribulose-phosphate 3-epimerase
MIPVVPALIPQSLEHAKEAIAKLNFSREIQLDLVDGLFAPTTSWPYDPVGDPMALKPLLDQFTLEVDLMVSRPLEAAEAWIKAGADMLVFHLESIPLEDFKWFAEHCRCTVGVAGHGNTTVEAVSEYAVYADYIQLMGIAEIGAQGQPFDHTVLERVATLHTQFPDMVIAVDGSVNKETIVSLKQAGVTRMVVGSAILAEPNPAEAHANLSALIN